MHSVEHSPISASLDTVRILAVHKQGLGQRPNTVIDKKTLLNTIDKIGLLQLDTINVVARNHYLVLLSRLGPYNPADFEELLYPDRRLFEQRVHEACLVPIQDYIHFSPVILARREKPHRKIDRLGNSAKEVLEMVLTEVEKRGPLTSRDFEDPRPHNKGWWDWKPAKLALEILFEHGYLMIDRRVNFHRHYDLTERVLPKKIGQSETLDDWKRWVTLRSLRCMGVATVRQISDYYRQQKTDVWAAIQMLIREGVVAPVAVEGWKETAYVHVKDISTIRQIEGGSLKPKITVLLPPFDNLIWDRNRVRDLFGFDYHVELYLPTVKKRQYGYYVMPILHNGQLVGRLDIKADRQNKTMIIHHIYFEQNQRLTDGLLVGLYNALQEFMVFHDCHSLVIEHTSPKKIRSELLSLIKQKKLIYCK